MSRNKTKAKKSLERHDLCIPFSIEGSFYGPKVSKMDWNMKQIIWNDPK